MASIRVCSSSPWLDSTKIYTQVQYDAGSVRIATKTYVQSVDCLETNESQRDALPLLHLILCQLKLLNCFSFGEVIEPDRGAVDQELDFSRSLRQVRCLDGNRPYPHGLVELIQSKALKLSGCSTRQLTVMFNSSCSSTSLSRYAPLVFFVLLETIDFSVCSSSSLRHVNCCRSRCSSNDFCPGSQRNCGEHTGAGVQLTSLSSMVYVQGQD